MKPAANRRNTRGTTIVRSLSSLLTLALVLTLASCGGADSSEIDGLKVTDLSLASGGEEVRVAFGMTARGCDYEISGPSSAVISGHVVNASSAVCPSGEPWDFEWDGFVLTTPDGSTLTANSGETVLVAAGEVHLVAVVFELAAPDSGRYTIAYEGTELKSANL